MVANASTFDLIHLSFFQVITEFSLSDKESDGYLYSVSIQTGAWRKSGTTANVGLVFYGVEDVQNRSSLHKMTCKEYSLQEAASTHLLYLSRNH